MNEIVFIGDWIKDRILGSGSFGTVVLWKHKSTDEKLAIKTCKWGDELTDKHRERWTKEVEMLRHCTNPNIVGTKELPVEFVKGLDKVNPSKLPILCMEYCSGGDLRQLINKTESSSGLKEIQVRQILSDVRTAVHFLHNNKITHRDLKPENIVMHLLDKPGSDIGAQNQRRVTYKLIDLGYAKEMDSNSVCASFVGTLQYLAPELFYSKTYSNSVDFWSLGILAFELICGNRPFLPFLAPVQWMPFVKKKLHENICVYETFHGDVEYSNEIFPENHVSKVFKALIENWLSVALEWDPKLRGRDAPSKVTFDLPSEEKEASSKIVIFELLEQILSKKIIKVFSLSTLSQHSFEIDDKTSVLSLKMWLFNDLQIPIQDQLLISQKKCTDISNDDLVVNYWNDQANTMLFLYNKKIIIKDTIEAVAPKSVQRCLEHPKTLYNYKNSQKLYRNGLYFVMTQMETYELLINGLFIRGESLKQESKQLLLAHNNVDKNIGKLLTKQEVVIKLIEMGKKHIERLREDGTGTNYLGGFGRLFKEADDIIEKISKLQNAWNQLSVRLQSASRRSNEVLTTDLNNFVTKYNFNASFMNASKAYVEHKKDEFRGTNRGKEVHCHDIVKICYDTLKLRGKILLELQHQTFILKLMDLSNEFTKISDAIKNAAETTEKFDAGLVNVIDQLTNCMWTTISILSTDADKTSDIPYSVVSFQKREFKLGEPVSNNCIKVANNVEQDENLKTLIKESLKLRKNHINLCEKLNTQKKLFKETSLNFSFLEDK